jgi:hypothetical protein
MANARKSGPVRNCGSGFRRRSAGERNLEGCSFGEFVGVRRRFHRAAGCGGLRRRDIAQVVDVIDRLVSKSLIEAAPMCNLDFRSLGKGDILGLNDMYN